MSVFFTAAVCVYNTEKYLRECLDSVLNQSYKNFELLIVDDGSTDESGCICDEYAEKDSRVRVIHTENQGVLLARKPPAMIVSSEAIHAVMLFIPSGTRL